jgi:hypothetical protein
MVADYYYLVLFDCRAKMWVRVRGFAGATFHVTFSFDETEARHHSSSSSFRIDNHLFNFFSRTCMTGTPHRK